MIASGSCDKIRGRTRSSFFIWRLCLAVSIAVAAKRCLDSGFWALVVSQREAADTKLDVAPGICVRPVCLVGVTVCMVVVVLVVNALVLKEDFFN